MEKIHIIFKPEMMFQDFIKSCWSSNIKTINGKIPINKILLNKGIFALDILPDKSTEVYCFALPVNKNWEPKKFDKNSILSFDLYCEESLSIDIIFQNSKKKDSNPKKIIVNHYETDKWINLECELCMHDDLRLILFSGTSENTPNYAIKDIIIKSK